MTQPDCLRTTKHPNLRSVLQREAHTSISACSDVTAAVMSSCHHVLLSLSCLTKYYGLEPQSFLVALWVGIQGDIPAGFDSW